MQHPMRFHTPMPENPLPVYIIGAGSVVKDGHLPAYEIAGFKVNGIYDPQMDKADALAKEFAVPKVFPSLEELLKEANQPCVFDVAVPGSVMEEVLNQLPEKSNVLLQKPMGDDLAQAREILRITREKNMLAAVNFQLRYAPYIAGLQDLMRQGLLGTITDVEIYVNTHTPWDTWSFLKGLSRMEILYHSIHYIDLMRFLLGEPEHITAQTWKHPEMEGLASVKSSIHPWYGSFLRAAIHTNHNHDFGPDQQDAYIKVEGTKGAVKIRLGLLLDYPTGRGDEFQYTLTGKTNGWVPAELPGSWFPHAFAGSMAELMRAAEGSITAPDNSVENIIKTMALVEAAYESCSQPGTRPKSNF